jgi:hypothetical protein
MLSHFVRSFTDGRLEAPFTFEEAEYSLALLSIGYAAVFVTFFALYAHALRNADILGLSEGERQLTRFALWQQGVHIAVGSVTAIAALTMPPPWSTFAGFIYGLIGPLIFIGGVIFVPARRRAPTPGM